MINNLPRTLKLLMTSSTVRKMEHTCSLLSSVNPSGLPLRKVVDTLNSYANTSLAASWDNVGLLIEPSQPHIVSHILLTNDLTEDVMQEAIDLKVNLIVSYHPPIFAPLKSITTKSWKERIAVKCLENRIALYSPHTSFDSIKGGVNDWLASAFPNIKSCKPIEEGENPENGMGRICVLNEKLNINEAVQLVKNHTKLQHIRLARSRGTDDSIKTIAICAGSGASVLTKVSADLYLTGEMLHHDILDAVHKGTNVILTNHSDSERGFLQVFCTQLLKLLNEVVTVSVSRCDADPLKTV